MEIARVGTGRARDARGFSMLQLMVTVAVVSVISGMAILGVRSSRAAMRLGNSSRKFAQNVERARLDAIRRHDVANIEFVSSTSYQITMDFANTGTKQTRQFDLDTGIILVNDSGIEMTSSPYPYADFDWRGRTSQCSMLFRLQNERGGQSTVQIAGSGDITVNNAISTMPNVNYANVNGNSNIVSTATVVGNNNKLNLSPCGASGGTVITPPTVTCNGVSWGLNYGYISIRRNGLSTFTVAATVPSPGTITASPDPNLSVSPMSRSITSSTGGTQTFTISSVTKTRGTFPVNFTFTCSTPAVLYVQVTN